MDMQSECGPLGHRPAAELGKGWRELSCCSLPGMCPSLGGPSDPRIPSSLAPRLTRLCVLCFMFASHEHPWCLEEFGEFAISRISEGRWHVRCPPQHALVEPPWLLYLHSFGLPSPPGQHEC